MLMTVDAELVGLQHWLDELDVMRDGVAARLQARRAELVEAQVVADAKRAARPTAPAPRRTVTLPARVVRLRRAGAAPGPGSWWAQAAPQGFTQQACRDHLARMSSARESLWVRGDLHVD
jgi:hypothetical protein